jgi:hypothetical protein
VPSATAVPVCTAPDVLHDDPVAALQARRELTQSIVAAVASCRRRSGSVDAGMRIAIP